VWTLVEARWAGQGVFDQGFGFLGHGYAAFQGGHVVAEQVRVVHRVGARQQFAEVA
jgi:hypothetical protein